MAQETAIKRPIQSITVYITPEQSEALAAMRQKTGKSQSDLVREACRVLATQMEIHWPSRVKVI